MHKMRNNGWKTEAFRMKFTIMLRFNGNVVNVCAQPLTGYDRCLCTGKFQETAFPSALIDLVQSIAGAVPKINESSVTHVLNNSSIKIISH